MRRDALRQDVVEELQLLRQQWSLDGQHLGLHPVVYLRGASRSLDAVRTAPNSKKRPPPTLSDGHESHRWREGTAVPRDAEINTLTTRSKLPMCRRNVSACS